MTTKYYVFFSSIYSCIVVSKDLIRSEAIKKFYLYVCLPKLPQASKLRDDKGNAKNDN